MSIRFWLKSTVLPTCSVLILFLLLIKFLVSDPQHLDQSAALIGFFSLYFILIRGGHPIMIRVMHNDLKSKFGKNYAARLEKLPPNLKQINLGFTLARIKRDLNQNSNSD